MQDDRNLPVLTLRAATPADVPAVVALVNSAYRGDSSRAGWTTEADLLGGQRVDAAGLLDQVTAPQAVVLVHEADGHVVACCHLERRGSTACIGMLTVQPTRQGSGLGRQLLAAAEAWAVTTFAARSMLMTVIAQRAELIAWYERRGYRRTGRTEPFPYGDERFGLPQRPDLVFVVLEKPLAG